MSTSCGSHSIEQASFTYSAANDRSDEERVSSITKGFDVTMTECPERVWPDYHWSQKKIYFTKNKTLKDEYEQKYSDEAKSIASTDQQEGTAFYAEIVGTALSQLGCTVDEKALISKSIEQLQASPDISGTSDSESYALAMDLHILRG
jgi:hypothetical protein